MSLVNDMLKALEQREGDIDIGFSQSDSLSDGIALTEKDTRISYLLVAIFCAIVIGGAYMVYSLQGGWKSGVNTVITSVGAQPTTSELKTSPVSNDNPSSAIELLPLPLTSFAKDSNQRIDKLLHEAELAALDDRLTDPPENNAYQRYQSILLIEPSHAKALAGIKGIVARYISFAQQTNQRGETDNAMRYWQKAQVIAEQYPSIGYWFDSQTFTLNHATAIARENIANTNGQDVLNANELPATAKQSEIITREQTLRVQPSRAYQDEQVSSQASELMLEQRWQEAKQLLRDVLAHNPGFEKCRNKLFELYAQRQEAQAAEALIGTWPKLTATRKNLLHAKLAIHSQDWPSALAHLEQTLSNASGDEEYLALLAAVYHRQQHYPSAAEQYQQLLDIDKSNSAYWLGLAVSHDALANRSDALRAFRFAKLYGGLDENTAAYVEQRINILLGSGSAG